MHKGWLLAAFVVVSLFQASHAGEWKECSSATNLGNEITVSSVKYTCCIVSASEQWTNDALTCDRPTVTVTHSPASVGLGAPVTFTAAASSQFDLDSIIINLDENNDGNFNDVSFTGTCTTGKTCTYSPPARTYNTEGQIVAYKAFATANKGGISPLTTPKSFTVSSNPLPAVSITPNPDKEWYGASSIVSLRFDYSDSSASAAEKLQSCEYTLTKGGTPSTTAVSCDDQGSATASASLNTNDCSEGPSGCSASARAKDDREFITPVVRNIGVDKTAPAATVPSISGSSCTGEAGKVGKGEEITYVSTVSDALSGIAAGSCVLQAKRSSDAWSSATPYPLAGGCEGTCSVAVSGPTALSQPGTYNLRVLCKDNAGNAMASNANIGNVEVIDAACESPLDVQIWDSKDPVGTVEAFTYTVSVKNTKAATASDVSFTLLLPSQIELLSTPDLGGAGSCSSSSSPGSGSSVTCAIGSLASGEEKPTSVSLSSTEASGTFTSIVHAVDGAGSSASASESTTVEGASSPVTTTTTVPSGPPSGSCPTEGEDKCVGGQHYVCQRSVGSLCVVGKDYQKYTDDMAGCFPLTDDGRYFRYYPGASQSQASALCAAGAHLCTPEEYLAKPESRTMTPKMDRDIRYRLALGPSGEPYAAYKCGDGRTYFARNVAPIPVESVCLMATPTTDNYMTSEDSSCTGITTDAYIGTQWFSSGSLIDEHRADFAGTCDDREGNGNMGALCCGTRPPGPREWVNDRACAPDFSIAHDPNPLVLAPGEMELTEVSIESINEFNGEVMLSGAWSGTALPGDAITEDGKNFMYIPDTINPAGGGIAVIYAGSTASGDYTLKTTGTSGSLVRTGDLTVRVAAPTDFAVVYPSPIMIIKKRQKGDAVAIMPVEIIPSSFAQPVTLSASWLDSVPAGVTFLFNPGVNTFKDGSPRQSDMIVTVTSTASEGVYILRTVGTAGAVERDTYLAVIIEPPGVESFIIGPDTITVNGIKYDYVERKFVDVLGQWQKMCTASEGCPDFTRGMASEFFVTATVNSIPEADCNPDVGCSGTYVFGGKSGTLRWNPFRKAWKGTLDTLDADFDGPCTDNEFDLAVNFKTETLSEPAAFKVHINCDPKVILSPYQARVPMGQKNAKIFDIMVYDPDTIGIDSERYDISLATDRITAKNEFIRHWISLECAPGECGTLDMTADQLNDPSADVEVIAALIADAARDGGVLSSDGLFHGGIPPLNPLRGLYMSEAALNDKGAQIAGNYEYVFRASRNPVTEGKGILSVYAEGLDQFSFLQAVIAMMIGSLIAITGARKP